MEEEDLKYLWAAYRMGSFGKVENISLDEFRLRTGDLLNNFDLTYTVVGETPKGKIPVGIISGKFIGPMFFIESAFWFKWASPRNKLETILHLLNRLRREYVVMVQCSFEEKRFFLNIAKHGVIRRVGTVYDVYDDGPAGLFQTRKS